MEIHEPKVAVPVELQIELAGNRQKLAATRYELNVRKGRSWDVHRNRTDKTPEGSKCQRGSRSINGQPRRSTSFVADMP